MKLKVMLFLKFTGVTMSGDKWSHLFVADIPAAVSKTRVSMSHFILRVIIKPSVCQRTETSHRNTSYSDGGKV